MRAEWEEFFPKHRLDKTTFVDILRELREKRNSCAVLEYWRYLAEEGTMYNILYALDKSMHWQVEVLIYSMAGFLDTQSYIEFKQMLGTNCHILEFVFALTTTPPNRGVVEHFVCVANSPRHHSPEIVKWFLDVAKSAKLDPRIEDQLTDNCSNAVFRWVISRKKKRRSKPRKRRDWRVLNNIINRDIPPRVYS